jgi:hypothetical protein
MRSTTGLTSPAPREADDIQELYLGGRKLDAAKAVPHDLVRAVSLVGEEEDLSTQVAEFANAGVTTLLLNPLARDATDRVAHVARLSSVLDRA